MKKTLLLILASLVLISSSIAGVPQEINYQGYLQDASGTAIDTTVDMTFKIYDSPTATSDLWNEDQTNVSVEAGIYNVRLGSVDTIPMSVFQDGLTKYLGVTVGTDTEMTPRLPIVAVPYAFRAASAEVATTALTANTVADSSITAAKLNVAAIDSSGKIPSISTACFVSLDGSQLTNLSTATAIADNTVSTAKISNLAVTAAKIADTTITSAKIVDLTITGGKLASNIDITTTGTVTAGAFSGDGSALTNLSAATAIADNTVSTAKISDLAVTTAKIDDDAVTSAKIADNTIAANNMGTGSVTGDAIASDIDITTFGSISAGSVVGTHYGDGSNLSGTTPSGTAGGSLSGSYPDPTVADDAVTTAKIANDAVTSGKVGFYYADSDTKGGAASSIANNSVTDSKVSASINITTSGSISAGSVVGKVYAQTSSGSALNITGPITAATDDGNCVGTAVVDNGLSYAQVSNTAVSANSLIFVTVATTENLASGDEGLRVFNVGSGSFRVTTADGVPDKDIPFNYLIIN